MTVNLNLNKQNYNICQGATSHQEKQSFRGAGELITNALIASDKSPMIGVSIIDLSSMIFPRTIIDATRNGFAATETFLRESAGLIINCLIPSFIVYGMAKILQRPVMGKEFKNLDASKFWANQQSNDILTNAWTKTKSLKDNGQRMNAFVTNILDNVQGLSGINNWKTIGESLGDQKQVVYENIASAITSGDKNVLKKATDDLISKIHFSRNLNFLERTADNAVKTVAFDGDIKNLLRDMQDMSSSFLKLADDKIPTFNKKLTKLINAKSFAGLAVIIALGASFQYFNRKLTKYRTGSDDFVGEADYLTKVKNSQNEKKSKQQTNKTKLNMQKLLGTLWMGLLATLSFGKIPKLNMFQFNGMFPTLNQCRAISAVTYSGRILSSANENELKESAFRDTFTFINLYFLGDYVSKAFASYKEKFGGLQQGDLLKHTAPLPTNDANIFKKFWHWFKHTELKSFDELANNPVIKKNRAFAQASGLLYSCIVLGLLVPLYNKYRTYKSAQQRDSNINISTQNTPNIMTSYQKNLFTAFCRNSQAS